MSTREKITDDLKDAMRAKDKKKLNVLRLITAAIKQIEVDERIEVDETRLLTILDKMNKQRKESITQYQKANRNDLVEQEQYEMDLITGYLPQQLSQEEVEKYINDAINATGAQSMADMGKVMAKLKPELQGRADMSQVSSKIKERLS